MVIRALLLVAAMAVAPAAAQTRIVSGNETSRFVPIELGQAIVVDLPEVVADVLVARPQIANVVMRTNTRAYIVAASAGDTNIYFFDAKKKQIEGLDVSVRPEPVQTPYPLEPKEVVTVFRGSAPSQMNCTRTTNLGNGARCYETTARNSSFFDFFGFGN
jgi:hypothetical protein